MRIKILIVSLILVLLGFGAQTYAIISVLDSAGKTCLDGEDSCYTSDRYLSTDNLNDRVGNIRQLVPIGYAVMGIGAVGFLVTSAQLIMDKEKACEEISKTKKSKK